MTRINSTLLLGECVCVCEWGIYEQDKENEYDCSLIEFGWQIMKMRIYCGHHWNYRETRLPNYLITGFQIYSLNTSLISVWKYFQEEQDQYL